MPSASSALHFGQALLPDGWHRDVRMEIADGLIRALASATPPQPGDERHAVAIPGLPNLHSHAFQRGMAGLAEVRGAGDDSFWTWRAVMYRFLDRLTPDDVQAIAAMAYLEMLETGFTRVGEFHYLHHDISGRPYAERAAMAAAIAAAAAETGIALTLLPVFYAHGGFGGAAPHDGQRRFVTGLDNYAALRNACGTIVAGLEDAVLGLAPHSLRAATPDELATLLAMAPAGPAHIHIAEQTGEVNACLAWSGARPVAWLLDHAPVDERWCLVHATHIEPAEARAFAATGAVAGLCPITEANLADGLFPAEAFLAAGGRYGVGSDSNILIDAAEELRWLEYGQRLGAHGRNLFSRSAGTSTGNALLKGALAGGAQALGASAALVVGAPADFVSLDAAHPSLARRDGAALVDGWIFAAGRGAVDGVWRRGRQVVAGGRHHARDAIVQRYRACLGGLLSSGVD